MLTILSVTFTVGVSNQEVATTNIKKMHSQALSQMLTNDIPKIGYDRKQKLPDKFVTADSMEISFYGNLDDNGAVEQITWRYYPQQSPEHSNNPHNRVLKRIVDGEESILNAGVTHFFIRYYDTYGSTNPLATPVPTSKLEDIVQIEIEMELQSDYKLGYNSSGDGNYTRTMWKKRFSPVNLRPN